MRSPRQVRSYGWIAAALLALALIGGPGSAALAKSKGKIGISSQDAIEQAIANAAPPQFFTLNEVLARRHGGLASKGPVRLASIDPVGLRGSFSELPQKSAPAPQGDEPFGLLGFRAPEGLLWTKWRSLEANIQRDVALLAQCRAEPDHCPPEARRFNMIVEAATARSGRARFEQINGAVNSAVRYTSDLVQHGVPDLWSAPLATFASGRGDCEDYAIAKYVALLQADVPPEDLRIVLVRHLGIGEAHAVLAARHDESWFVLDNLRSTVVEDNEITQFRPLFTLDHQGVKLLAASYAPRNAPRVVSRGALQEAQKIQSSITSPSDDAGAAELDLSSADAVDR